MRIHAKLIAIILMLLLITASATLSVGYVEKSDHEINSNFGYPPETEWYKTYGNNDTNDFACGIIPSEDGGYILAGYLYPFGIWEGESWVMKIGSNGEIIWNKTYDANHYAFCLTPAIDGGYVIVGCKESYSLDDIWLLKIDDNGNEQWNKTYGGTNDDWGNSVQQTIDGGYVITGGTYSFGAGYVDVWLIKTDSQGKAKYEPPTKPTIKGQSGGTVGSEYRYYLMSIDPEGYNITYCIDWGDNTREVCIGPYPSGEQASAKHVWCEQGDYTVKAKSRNTHGAESDWTTLYVSMPKTHIHSPIIELIMKIFQSFPFLEKILNQII